MQRSHLRWRSWSVGYALAALKSVLKMSLCCKWYLGLASFWANNGVADRKLDYQIWCGPAIGAFNDFVKQSYLDPAVSGQFPCVVQVNLQILRGASYYRRLNAIKKDGDSVR